MKAAPMFTMMMQEAIERAQRLEELGQLDDTINVTVVRMVGVRLVSGTIPRAVRSELSQAVKSGRLGRLQKNGLEPEAYFHPNSRPRAIDDRRRVARKAIEATRGVIA